jgi:dTDP-glucose 4,6-dehydratase
MFAALPAIRIGNHDKMKLVVVTGCLGFIGSYVTRVCLERGWKVYGVDKCTYASNPSLLEEFQKNINFSFSKEDIATLTHLPDCDYIINVAAETHVGNSILDSADFIHTNVEGVKNLLDVIRFKPDNICAKPVFFHFSTDEVYGDITTGSHTEKDLMNPSNPYSASKAASDMLIKAWARTYGLEYIILRPTNNYGTYQHTEKLIPLSVKLLQWGKKIRLHDAGLPVRNWLHAADTAAAVTTIIDSGAQNKIFNVSGGFEQSNKETVKKIIQEYYSIDTDWENYVDLGYKRIGQDVRYSLDDTNLRNLGWKPRKIFNTEIKSIVEFYKNKFYW